MLFQQQLQDRAARLRYLDAAPGRHRKQRAVAARSQFAECGAGVPDNLRREAASRGVAPARLVFAERLSAADLARQRLADLFLDTLPYNAHTTASDALWAGLPVLTRLGETFAGRVAASLLKAVGLDELIAHSSEEYEALALKLARDASYLASIKEKLARNRVTAPLFDTPAQPGISRPPT